MGVDLFLGIQDDWPKDSPHCLVILHDMFLHAASEGWKEAEWYICWGIWQHMPQLNPEAGVPTVELVGLETSRDKLLEIYLEVYKPHQLPGCPPGELAIVEEVLAAVPDWLQRREEALEAWAQPSHGDSHPTMSRRPHWEWESSVDRSLARMCKAHWKVLSTMTTLEEEIERLSRMRACSWSRVRSRSQDCWRSKERGRKRECHQVSWPADPEIPSGAEGSKGRDADLGELQELAPTVASFLWGSLETSDDEGGEILPEPAVLDLAEWVQWKAEKCDTPSWWMKLSAVPGQDNTRKLARQVRASFGLPQQLWELDAERATLQAPPALPCLHWQTFMPLPDSIFASRDIREVPRENVVAYARALQYWVEKNYPPTGGDPHSLAKGVLELQIEVKWYLTFTNEEVFQGVSVPEAYEEKGLMTPSPTNVPKTPPILEPQPKEQTAKFIGWDKVLHPFWPVIATGETPQPTWTSTPRRISHPYSQVKPVKSPIHLPKVPSPSEPSPSTKAVAPVKPSTPPCGFEGVLACLKMPEVSVGTVSMGLASGMSSVSSSCVMRDDITGITHVDMITTSFGRIILSDLNPNASSTGPVIEDITNWE